MAKSKKNKKEKCCKSCQKLERELIRHKKKLHRAEVYITFMQAAYPLKL